MKHILLTALLASICLTASATLDTENDERVTIEFYKSKLTGWPTDSPGCETAKSFVHNDISFTIYKAYVQTYNIVLNGTDAYISFNLGEGKICTGVKMEVSSNVNSIRGWWSINDKNTTTNSISPVDKNGQYNDATYGWSKYEAENANVKFKVANNYALNIREMTIYYREVEPSSTGLSLSGVDSAEAPAEYFNLQGNRVSADTKGLVIVKRGNTVSKEMR